MSKNEYALEEVTKILSNWINPNFARSHAEGCNLVSYINDITWYHLIHQDEYDAQINNFLQGKVLTIIDAAIHEERANKAIKDLIKWAFREQYKHIYCSTPVWIAGIQSETN